MLDKIQRRHRDTLRSLLPEAAWADLEAAIAKDIAGLHDILRAVVLMKTDDDRTQELVSGHGELWSAQIIAALLRSRGHPFQFVDAREVLVVSADGPAPGDRTIHWDASRAKLQEVQAKAAPGSHLLVTGFIASTPAGVMTTLGRDGSDYTASIVGRLLSAQRVTIWTDVSGVFSADPRRVPEAHVVPRVTYDEAIELAFFGAKVLHPKTMAPAVAASIPLFIRNTFEPDAAGTCISAPSTTGSDDGTVVRGFSTVDNLALFNLEGDGLMGVVGTAATLFRALERAAVNVVMIAQASSEHSICFAVPLAQAAVAAKSVEESFFREIHVGDVAPVTYTGPVSIIAAVGDGMCATPGTSGRFFDALGRAHINVLAISQGSSERNISAVVSTPDATRALRAVHAAFRFSGQELSLGVCGPTGTVAAAGAGAAATVGFGAEADAGAHSGDTPVLVRLMSALLRRADAFRDRLGVDVAVRGVHNGRRMLLVDERLGADWAARFAADATPLDEDAFAKHIRADHMPHWAVVDCNTVLDRIVGRYPTWLGAGMHVLTANLAAPSAPLAAYRGIRTIAEGNLSHTRFTDDSSIAAGLPVLRTIDDVVVCGQEVMGVQATLSAGVNHALAAVQASLSSDSGPVVPFSAAVQQALECGMLPANVVPALAASRETRVAVALGRRIGLARVDVADVRVDALLPDGLTADDERKTADVLDGLRVGGVDARVQLAAADAAAQGAVLRYVLHVAADGSAGVGLKALSQDHPLAAGAAQGSDVRFAVQTTRDAERPMLLQAAPSSSDTVAAALCGDVWRLAVDLGARSHRR